MIQNKFSKSNRQILIAKTIIKIDELDFKKIYLNLFLIKKMLEHKIYI